jgi:hypothetical protein
MLLLCNRKRTEFGKSLFRTFTNSSSLDTAFISDGFHCAEFCSWQRQTTTDNVKILSEVTLSKLIIYEVEVTLRPTVSRPVLVSGPHSGPATNFSFSLRFSFWLFRVCYFAALSLTRGRVCNLQLLLVIIYDKMCAPKCIGCSDASQNSPQATNFSYIIQCSNREFCGTST